MKPLIPHPHLLTIPEIKISDYIVGVAPLKEPSKFVTMKERNCSDGSKVISIKFDINARLYDDAYNRAMSVVDESK